jgi:membrane-associated phospholipid phosphatase
MSSELTSGIGLDIIIWLQENSNGLFDVLAQVLHFMGSSAFYLVVLSLMYWSFDKRLGLRVLFALLLGSLLNALLKELFQEPRPFQLHPGQVTALVEQDGYAFPSGHVMQVVIVWGMAALYTGKRQWLWSVVALALLMAWGRMYAGVHYPQDVLGGAFFGILALLVIVPLFDFLSRVQNSMSLAQKSAVPLLLGLAIFFLTYGNHESAAAAGTIIGAGIGLLIDAKYIHFSPDGTEKQRLLRYIIGIVLVIIIYVGFGALFDTEQSLWIAARLFLVGLTVTAAWPYLAKKAGLASS